MSKAFELVQDEYVKELNSQIQLYRHVKTGARIMSVLNDDENKVFGVTFRTPPQNSKGLPHIMEHSVLCGSQKYPIKEPFIELIKSSLYTFLNAMTYPDKTTYPVASQNEQDFYNLVNVYLDAVFNPLITEETFQQEGWHYELEKAEGPLSIKGIVYNEMKGAYSDSDSLFFRNIQQNLFQNHSYGVDSGGDPLEISKLSYQEFQDFYQNYYHPSNAWIFFYGDDDPKQRLEIIEEYLAPFEANECNTEIPLLTPIKEIQKASYPYESEEEGSDSKKTKFAQTWLLPENNDPELNIALSILSYMLVSTPASPLRKALLDSQLGEELIGNGLSSYLRQMTFTVGLKGVAEEDIEKVQSLISETLEKLANNGFDLELQEAALNTLEFQLRENNTGSYPRGLALMLDALSIWLHDGNPIEAVSYEAPLALVKKRLLEEPKWLLDLMRKHIIENQHRVDLSMIPQKGLRQAEEEIEKKRLSDIHSAMSQEERQRIIEETQKLKLAQETPDSPENLAKLPSLKLSDIERKNKEIPIELSQYEGYDILYHDLFTNGIIYFDVGFDLHCLPQEWIPYIPLFKHALVEIGTETENDVQIAQRIRRKTGGIWASSLLSAKQNTPQGIAYFFLKGKATLSQAPDLLAIFRDLLLNVNFDDQQRFLQMALRAKSNLEAGLIPGGHGVVSSRLSAHFNTNGWASEQLGGVEQILFLRRLVEQIENDWSSILTILRTMREHLVNRSRMLCNITIDAEGWEEFAPLLNDWITSIPTNESQVHTWKASSLPKNEGLVASAQVNYVGKGFSLYPLGYKYHASIAVILKNLRTSWLWEKVRMQGGAYGAMCGFNRRSGTFTLLSYRDPNILPTLEAYDKTNGYLHDIELSQEDLERSIIGTIGDIDSYQLPDAKGYSSMVRHLLEESPEFRQKLRDQIFETQISHFQDFADIMEKFAKEAHIVVMGSEENLEEANQKLAAQLELNYIQKNKG